MVITVVLYIIIIDALTVVTEKSDYFYFFFYFFIIIYQIVVILRYRWTQACLTAPTRVECFIRYFLVKSNRLSTVIWCKIHVLPVSGRNSSCRSVRVVTMATRRFPVTQTHARIRHVYRPTLGIYKLVRLSMCKRRPAVVVVTACGYRGYRRKSFKTTHAGPYFGEFNSTSFVARGGKILSKYGVTTKKNNCYCLWVKMFVW